MKRLIVAGILTLLAFAYAQDNLFREYSHLAFLKKVQEVEYLCILTLITDCQGLATTQCIDDLHLEISNLRVVVLIHDSITKQSKEFSVIRLMSNNRITPRRKHTMGVVTFKGKTNYNIEFYRNSWPEYDTLEVESKLSTLIWSPETDSGIPSNLQVKENGIYQLLLKISRIHDNEEIFYLAGNTEGLHEGSPLFRNNKTVGIVSKVDNEFIGIKFYTSKEFIKAEAKLANSNNFFRFFACFKLP